MLDADGKQLTTKNTEELEEGARCRRFMEDSIVNVPVEEAQAAEL